MREPLKIAPERERAMWDFVGTRKDRPDMADPESEAVNHRQFGSRGLRGVKEMARGGDAQAL